MVVYLGKIRKKSPQKQQIQETTLPEANSKSP